MDDKPIRQERAQIYCRAETKESVRALKRGGETFDEVLRRIASQFDLETGRELKEDNGDV